MALLNAAAGNPDGIVELYGTVTASQTVSYVADCGRSNLEVHHSHGPSIDPAQRANDPAAHKEGHYSDD